jgi:hypothetical protein
MKWKIIYAEKPAPEIAYEAVERICMLCLSRVRPGMLPWAITWSGVNRNLHRC